MAIFERNAPAAYLVSSVHYEQLLNRLEDYELGEIVKTRQAEKCLLLKFRLMTYKLKFLPSAQDDGEIIVFVIAVGKRENNAIYDVATQRKS